MFLLHILYREGEKEREFIFSILQIAQTMVVLAVKLSFYFQQCIALFGITDDPEGA